MELTYEEVKARLQRIVAEKGEDYVYTTDPKAIETAKVRATELRSAKTPNFSTFTGVRVDSTGNEVVENCTYRNLDGTPGCIIGHLFYGIDPNLVFEEQGFDRTLLAATDIVIDTETEDFLAELQFNQDCGQPWGTALANTINKFEGDDV